MDLWDFILKMKRLSAYTTPVKHDYFPTDPESSSQDKKVPEKKRIGFLDTISREYREDLQLWEEKIKILWFLHYYVYSIRKSDKLWTKKTIVLKSRKTKKYFKLIPLSPIIIGKKEFEKEYNNNKWSVPVNYEIDLTRP